MTDIPGPLREFRQMFSATPRGARLARLMAELQLQQWGWPYGSEMCRTVTQTVGELAANAVTHGRVAGRDFQLRLATGPGTPRPAVLRAEVLDARGERRPDPAAVPPALPPPDAEAESGRGLWLVGALAHRWGVRDHLPSGKGVWAEWDLPPGCGGPQEPQE
ncbi:ATP-binding protein [Streptomyces sp. YIM 98790]|uniref:ATP-binding protein n=1 Tax=Streptomyces sp. YIM 98790 TaxID=2689077 RepID=UPI001408A554|nr:ATP-binding protein [Streptomyces sp. YIM 98790]